MNKICVYAIAKDESKFVDAGVKSMSAADHIVVLDTGSTDDTVEKLRSLGVEVHEKEYDHFRFDIARNDSLDLVPDEYNIRVCTDLDELFEQENWADILREKWDENNPRVIYHYVGNHTADGENGLEFDINKIHGTDPDLRGAGAVHEHLTFMSTGERMFTKYIDLRKEITLHHYADLTKDRRFYIELAEERIKDQPNDMQAYVLLGNEYRVKGSPEKAIEKYETVLKKFSKEMNTVEQAAVYYALGDAYHKTGNAVMAMTSFSHGMAIHKTYRDNYFGLAVIYVNNQMYHAAIGLIQEALHNSRREYYGMEDALVWTYPLYDLLGFAYFSLGDYENAVAASTVALEFEPSNRQLRRNHTKYTGLLKQKQKQ